jgi:putative transposase
MNKSNVVSIQTQALVVAEGRTNLEQLLREGAQRMLQKAIENEVQEFMQVHAGLRTEDDHQAVVRNGSMPTRQIVTGLGPLEVQQPRVRDRRGGEKIQFSSNILPKYLRRVPSLDALIPALYLRGISTGDFTEALESILGPNAGGLSAANIVRLKEGWEAEYEAWTKRDLSGKRYVYWWADGVYFNVRLDDQRRCILVLMGALADGTKELLAVVDGERESKLSWVDLLRNLKAHGLTEGPSLAVGDGGLGFWAAMAQEYPGTQEQRCWVHKTANVLDKLPKTLQPAAKDKIHQMFGPFQGIGFKSIRFFPGFIRRQISQGLRMPAQG